MYILKSIRNLRVNGKACTGSTLLQRRGSSRLNHRRGKSRLQCFGNSERPILEHYQERCETVNLERYCPRSNEDDCRKIAILQHDNVRPPTANKTLQTIRDWKSELLECRPYGPDLAPGDLHTFGPLKYAVIWDHFSKDEEVKNRCIHG